MGKWRTWLDTHVAIPRDRTIREERINVVTHGAAVPLAVAALVYLTHHSNRLGDTALTAALAIYGAFQVLEYGISTAYHATPPSTAKRFLLLLDHGTIFLLIAGTYTPICIAAGGSTGTTLLISSWILAVLGFALSPFLRGRWMGLKMALYLANGWLAVVFWGGLKQGLPVGMLGWTLAGGIIYTAGTLFFGAKKIPYHHGIWHLFVIGGGTAFFLGFSRVLLG